jgi:cell division protein ZapA
VSGKRSISVRILGQQYRIRSDADEESVQRVALLVDETMARIRARTRTVDTLDLAILAALNLANELVALRDAAPSRAEGPRLDQERLGALLRLVESASAGNAAEVG